MIRIGLQKGWPHYQPGFIEEDKKADDDKIRNWMRGFSKAMCVEPEYWVDLAQDEKTSIFLAPLVGFMDPPEGFEERDDADEMRDKHAALLPRTLVAMYKLALLSDEDANALTAITAVKVGRNEPCPCGSGRKYKRCCAGR